MPIQPIKTEKKRAVAEEIVPIARVVTGRKIDIVKDPKRVRYPERTPHPFSCANP